MVEVFDEDVIYFELCLFDLVSKCSDAFKDDGVAEGVDELLSVKGCNKYLVELLLKDGSQLKSHTVVPNKLRCGFLLD